MAEYKDKFAKHPSGFATHLTGKKAKSQALKNKKGKEKEPYFGLPHGVKDTPQLRKRFKNYVKKNKKNFGYGDKKDNYKLQRDNSYYEFDKPDYD